MIICVYVEIEAKIQKMNKRYGIRQLTFRVNFLKTCMFFATTIGLFILYVLLNKQKVALMCLICLFMGDAGWYFPNKMLALM
ncbi:hypothetical protein D0T87_21875 [Bacteroides sp. 51]|nr:hypothetical protein [Bacteroides sp. 51]